MNTQRHPIEIPLGEKEFQKKYKKIFKIVIKCYKIVKYTKTDKGMVWSNGDLENKLLE